MGEVGDGEGWRRRVQSRRYPRPHRPSALHNDTSTLLTRLPSISHSTTTSTALTLAYQTTQAHVRPQTTRRRTSRSSDVDTSRSQCVHVWSDVARWVRDRAQASDLYHLRVWMDALGMSTTGMADEDGSEVGCKLRGRGVEVDGDGWRRREDTLGTVRLFDLRSSKPSWGCSADVDIYRQR
ncbi:hypothetical protein SCHPADRAFT_750198 [Schizopora paradoxa]|uniref:Uncharacterized protein n=1 Tax=Schizopora paradoxa TaxID=27342 RepID=A0A0H2QYU7_9AGAM|nr:hypothetical protein SCHPADRAFT_750198 [Schizopora paradoxa]